MLDFGLSIVLTYYKGEKFIFNCLNSIFDSYDLSKKSIEFEVIIVIDSIDDSAYIESKLLSTYNSRPLKVEKNSVNIGVSKSRNFGLKKIKYQFYTIIDQDDYVLSKYFSILESNLDSKFSIHLLNGIIEYKEENIQVPIYSFTPKFFFKNILQKNTFIYTPGLIVFNSQFVGRDNLFIDTSDQYKGCDDWAAYLNLILSVDSVLKYKFIDSKLFVYCLHSSNYSNNKKEMIFSSIAVLDYLAKFKNLSARNIKLIQKARCMQDFYFSKEVEEQSLFSLLITKPNQFLSHYLLPLFEIDNYNKIRLKLSYRLKKLTKARLI